MKHRQRHWQVVDVFIRCSTAPIAVVAPMYAPFYEDSARDCLPTADPLLSFSVRAESSAVPDLSCAAATRSYSVMCMRALLRCCASLTSKMSWL